MLRSQHRRARNGWTRRRTRLGDAGGERHRSGAEEDDLAVAEVGTGHGRAGGRARPRVGGAAVAVVNDLRRSDPSTPQAEELFQGGRLVVNIRDDPGLDHSRLFLRPVDAGAWIVLTLDGDKYAEKFDDYARVRVPRVTGPESDPSNSIVAGPSGT